MIVVTGPAKVGKTSAIKLFVSEFPDWTHVVGSQILREKGRPIDNLSATDAAVNQECIRFYLQTIKDRTNTIFDGHFLINIKEGKLLVSHDIMRGLGVTDVIFVEIPSQSSPELNASEGQRYSVSHIELLHSSEVARSLRAKHHHVSGNDLADTGSRLHGVLVEAKVAIEKDLS